MNTNLPMLSKKVKTLTYVLMFLLAFSLKMNAQDCNIPVSIYPWTDNFEAGFSPCYQQTFIVESEEWILHHGGYQAQSGFLGYPKEAHSGSWNLWFFSETVGSKTRLVLPKFDLEGGENTTLNFWHAQFPWSGTQDVLKIYYKNSIIGDWILLETYSEAVEEWTERTIVLPNPTSTYWIAFEGTANFGRGIVVDDITVNCTGCMTGCDRPVNVSRIMHTPNYFDVKLVWNAPDTTGYDIQIEGYNIYKNDGTLLTANPITENFYQLTNLDPTGSYSYGVTVVYSDGCESEKAPINFTLTNPPEITMPTTGTITYSTCNGIIFDDGGQSADYSNDCNGILIIQPDQSGYGATIQGSYNIESGNDKLYVYEGSGINGTLLETYSGTNGNIPLTASTLGPLTLRFTSNSSVVKSGFTIHVTCTEIEDCLPPFELTADVVNASEINLTWTSSGEGDVSWNLEYGIAGFTPGIGSGTVISNIETTSYTITGTAPVSSYDVYIQTNCIDGDTSIWSAPCSFTTPCSIFTPPYFESFDDEIFPPNCWATIHTAGSGSSLWQRNTSATYIHSGSGSAKLPDQSVGNITDLVTGQLNISAANAYQITFWMYRSNYSSIKPNEGVKVWVNNTPDTVGGTELLHIRRQYTLEPIVPEIGWYEYSVPIPSSGIIYVIFQGISEFGSASYIDDIMIDAIPACPKPTDLTATIPTESSITLNWTAGGDETSWNLEYGPIGFELGSGTLVENVTNPYVLNGLTSSTEYSYYVQGNCSDGGTSNWSTSCDFTTSCGSATLPLTEGFEAEDFPPTCWTTEHIAGSGSYVWQRNTTATYVHTGTASAKLPDQPLGNITILATNPLLVPEANAYQIIFWMYRSNYSSTKPNEGVKVWVNNSPDTIGGTELLYIRRQYTLEPIVPEIGWYEYSAIIPQSGTLYIVFEGISEYGQASYIDDVTVSILPSCPKPTALSASNPSETSIELGWVAAAGQSSWNLEYGLAGFEQGTGTIINNVTQNPYTLTGLSASTQYSVYAQANCTGDETSEWSSACNFATTCGLFNIPLVENFDNMGESGSSVFPDCWTRLHTASTANPYVYTTYNFSAPACLYFYSSSSNYSFAVTPELNISSINTLQVRFMGRASNLSYHLDIGVMTDPTDIETFELVETATITATGVWEEFEISLANYQGIGKYVAFRSDRRDESATNTFYLDDLFIEELPACAKPIDVTASNPTETSIDLTWSPNAGETSWNIQYGPLGFILGEGTIISNVTNPYTLSGLLAATSYTAYVQANCMDGGVSGWSSKCDFNTSCGFVAVPYTENFDTYGTGSNAFPPCWSRPVTYGTSTIYPSCVTAQKVSDPASLRFQSSTSDPSYAVTPQFSADIHSLMVTFQLKAESTTNSGTFEVGVMSDPTDISGFESVEIITPTSTSWTAYEVSFNNTILSGGNKCIAFRHNANSTAWYYWLDDIFIETIPSCPRPTDFEVIGTTDNTASLSWMEAGTATTWNLEYGPAGFVQGSGTIVASNSTTHTISGLTIFSTYDVYVQSNCGENDLSLWVGPISFTCGISEYNMPSSGSVTITTCGATIYDDGGPDANYTNSSDGTMIIMPGTLGAVIQLEGTYVSETNYDELFIYDGAGTEGTLLGTFSNSNGGTIPLIVSTEGPLTLHFSSDGSVNKSGFVLTVTCEGGGSCPRPTNFAATNIYPRSVVLDWTAGATESSWEVEYGLSGFVHGTGTSLTATSHPFTVSDLLPETNYDFHVRALCSATDTSEWKSLIGITTMISCPEPSDLAIVSVTQSSATLTWTENGSATAWNLEYGLEGFTPGTGTVLTNVSNPYTINGLTAGVAYHYYVQAACGEGDLSLWVGPKKFTPGSGINECVVIGEGTTGTYTLPLNTFYKHSYSQQIITSDELMDLGAMPGSTINSVAFQYFYSTAQTKDPVTIYLGEVERTAFASSTDWEPVGNMEQVFTGSITFDNSGEDYWVEVEFDNSYSWNGDNLIVAVLNNNGAYTTSSSSTFYKHTATENISLRYQVDGTTPINLESFTSTGTRSSDRSNIRLCVTSGGSSTCRTPNALETTTIMANLVTLTWIPRGTETSWEVEYGPAGFIQGTGTIVATDFYPFDVTGLTPFTTYDFYVRAVCAENDYSPWKALLNITTLESCLRPSDFALAGITETTATIAWTENGGSTSWNIEYGVEGFELGTGIPINHITTNPYTIVGLADATRYDCYIQSICSADNQSIWVGPISFSAGSIDCGVIGEGTVGAYNTPVNTFYNYSYTQQIFRVDELSNLGIGAGEIKSVAFQYIYSTPQTKDNITIYLGNTSKDEFVSNSDWESVDNMQIVFTGSITFDNSGDDYWLEIPFTQNFFWNGTSNLLIAVLNNHGDYTTSSNYTFYTHSTEDNLSIRYQNDGSSINPASITSGSTYSSRNNVKLCFVQSEVPSCTRPSNVTITNSTATSAQITWSSSSSATSWNIELGERGFNPSLIPTYSNISNPHTLTDLTPNVEYAFYLQSNCSGNEVSDWIGPYYFTTACDMVLDIPVTEGFENGEKPECWQNIQIEGSGNWNYQAGVIEADPQTAFEGNYNALLYSPNVSITQLVTPTINLSGLTQTPILAFAYAQPSWGFGQDKLSIWVKNASTSTWSKIAEYSENIEEWVEESIVLPNPSATYWIAFEVEGNWGHGVGLDEVKVLQDQVAPIQGNINVCAQGSETYTTTAGMSGYVWNVLGGEITSGQGTNTITVLWGESGNGRVDVIYDGLNYNNNVSITIGESPIASVVASDYEICAGQPTTLSVIGEGNYLWSTGETTASIVVNPTETTVYTVSVYDNEQCAAELEVEIIVNDLTDIHINGNNSICFGESTILTAVGGVTYLWSTGETTNSIVVSPVVNTFYTVLATDEIGCSNYDSILILVTEIQTPQNLNAEPLENTISLTWNEIAGSTKYYIYRDDVKYDSTAVNNFEDHNIIFNTDYCYTVSAFRNACESVRSNSDCTMVTGIEEIDNSIRIYPNPAKTDVTIECNDMGKVEIFNIVGQNVASFSTENQVQLKVNTTHYETGTYIIRIETKSGQTISKRIVIMH